MLLATSSNKTITLGNQLGSAGGEGSVYQIKQTQYKDHCVKIFNDNIIKDNNKIQEKFNKLQFMINNQPKEIEGDCFRLCYPTELVFNQGKFCGYIMPISYKNSISLYDIKPTNFKNKNIPNIFKTKYDRTNLDGVINRAKLCTNIAIAIYQLHAINAVIVDLKPTNLQITDNGKISIIDIDSIQVIDKKGILYKSPVATPEYCPPEFFSGALNPTEPITEYWDRFSCAVLFYEILFGIHPFSANFNTPYDKYQTIQEKIHHGLFVFGKHKNYLIPLTNNPHQNFDLIPDNIKKLFIRTFVDGHMYPSKRVSIIEFAQEFFDTLKKK